MAEAPQPSEATGRCRHSRSHLNSRSRCVADLAVTFSLRSSSTLAQSSLQRWRQVHTSHQNAQAFAVHYHSVQLRFKMVMIWRVQLRAKLKLAKQARIAEKYFAIRNAWKMWQEKLAEKRRERKLKVFEARMLQSYMHGELNSLELRFISLTYVLQTGLHVLKPRGR